ncbi:MAG: hypothetical protein ABJP52_13860, partial [Flavobacteriaceae bacterium]
TNHEPTTPITPSEHRTKWNLLPANLSKGTQDDDGSQTSTNIVNTEIYFFVLEYSNDHHFGLFSQPLGGKLSSRIFFCVHCVRYELAIQSNAKTIQNGTLRSSLWSH